MASLLSTLSIFSQLARAVYNRNKKATSALCLELNIPKDKHERIAFYTGQSAITNYWFGTLRGKPATKPEQRNALLIGAITPLLDDAVDEDHKKSSEILRALMRPDKDQPSLPARLFKALSADRNLVFLDAFKIALQAQDASLKQLQEQKLTDEELIPITSSKGGSWTFLYRTVMTHPVAEREQEAIYKLGYLMQLTNDAFDVYNDVQNGQQTLFTNAIEIEPLKDLYLSTISDIQVHFMALPYAMRNKRKCLNAIAPIAARGLVCIDQLLALQHKSEGTFKPASYSRQALICDMEKPKNIWKSVQFAKTMFA